jgi:hypothetical protein
VIGYVSDRSGDEAGFWKAQYALAPHLLVQGGTHALSVANLQHAGNLRAICRENGLAPVKVDRAGVALLRPAGEP